MPGIQFTAEYDNEIQADLADAIAVVLAIVTPAAAGLDAVASVDDGRVIEGVGRAEGGL